MDQNIFMNAMKELIELAKVKENVLEAEEIKTFMEDFSIDDRQLHSIFQYLMANGIKIPNVQIATETAAANEEEAGEEAGSVSYRIYMEELSEYNGLGQSEKEQLFLTMRGEQTEEAKQKIIEGYLPVVVELAKRYQDKGMPLEDLIQEGNLGLLAAVNQLHQLAKLDTADEFLVESIRKAIVESVDLQIAGNDWEQTILAKTQLLHEANTYLAKEWGRVATIQELAEFTKMTMEEIEALQEMSNQSSKD